MMQQHRYVLESQTQETLQRTLVIAGETCEISQKTAEELNSQTEQLYRIKDTTDQIQSNLDTSHYLLAGMKSWWSSVIQTVFPPPPPGGVSSSSTTTNVVSKNKKDDEKMGEYSNQQNNKSSAKSSSNNNSIKKKK